MDDQIRNDMAKKGYVYRRDTKNFPPRHGFRQLCRDLRGEDISKLIFDTDAYEAHGHNNLTEGGDLAASLAHKTRALNSLFNG